MLTNFLYVFLGGGMGSLVRFSISIATAHFFKSTFPVATLLSNLVSCFVLGISLFLFYGKLNSELSLKFLIITGFFGGFSTFSAFSYETVSLLKIGQYQYAILNILLNVVLCFGIIWLLLRSEV